jgi:hypothetical protein
MSSKIGVWIDHRKALIADVTGEHARLTIINSNVEKHPERSGDSPLQGPFEAAQVPPDDRRERALTGHLNAYYDSVVNALPSASNILIFGPGEAKGEFRKRLERLKPGAKVSAVEPADKMTDGQVIAKVREYHAQTVVR